MTVTQNAAFASGPTAAAVIRAEESRRTQAPSGLVTTLASPTQGGAGLAVWRMDITPGAAGPVHAYDTEQVWTVISGAATVELDGGAVTVAPGDTLVIPAGATRQMIADPQAGVSAISITPAGTRAYTPGGPVQVDPHCALPEGDKLIPAWVV
ncbi:MAG TPA: cupin domain-containing protein [Streptosporangiaceae bacterium]|nr:cupin domain-containing protein [Streptosporangiaceae bacterium]